MTEQRLFSITESSAVAEARREATALARTLGFDESGAGKAALVVSEAATNLVKHATRGQLLLRPLEGSGSLGLEILALDGGPGIANASNCLRDGYSTTGSPGTGLGAISRLADEFDIHSVLEKGTAMVAQLWTRIPTGPRPPSGVVPPNSQQVGVICLPKPGESECGDAWGIKWKDGRRLVMVTDGLGHGPDAAAASSEAVASFKTQSLFAPGAMIEFLHGALRYTRGAAVAVAEFTQSDEIRYSGVGNIVGVIISPNGDRHMVSHNGIVGHELRKVQEFVYPWPQEALLVMHSDGLTSHWNLDQYPGLISRHPSLIAGVLYRDFTRGRDDVTVLVIKRP